MVPNESSKLNVFLIRVMLEFYPTIGGSVTHTLEEIKEINSHVEGQIIIAPDYGIDCSKFDSANPIPVLRVRFPIRLVRLQKQMSILPIQPLILLGFAINSMQIIRMLAEDKSKNLIIHVEGTLLGAIINFLLLIQSIRIPLIITQHSANPFRISIREFLATILALLSLSIKKPRRVLVLDDGMGIKEFGRVLSKLHIKWSPFYHAFNDDFFIAYEEPVQDEFIVLSTARLDPFKRVDLAIISFAKFVQETRIKNARMIIAGSGSENEKLRIIAKEENIEGQIDFVGEKSISEVRELLRRASVIIGTSLKSNINRSIQEAMSASKPVIIFDNGSESQMITNMIEGILVKSGEVESLAKGLLWLFNNPELRREMGRKARERMIQEKSWDNRIQDNLSAYKSIIDQRRI